MAEETENVMKASRKAKRSVHNTRHSWNALVLNPENVQHVRLDFKGLKEPELRDTIGNTLLGGQVMCAKCYHPESKELLGNMYWVKHADKQVQVNQAAMKFLITDLKTEIRGTVYIVGYPGSKSQNLKPSLSETSMSQLINVHRKYLGADENPITFARSRGSRGFGPTKPKDAYHIYLAEICAQEGKGNKEAATQKAQSSWEQADRAKYEKLAELDEQRYKEEKRKHNEQYPSHLLAPTKITAYLLFKMSMKGKKEKRDWKSLTKEEQEPFFESAKKQQIQYQKEYAEYETRCKEANRNLKSQEEEPVKKRQKVEEPKKKEASDEETSSSSDSDEDEVDVTSND